MQKIATKSCLKLRFSAGNIQQIRPIYKGIERAFSKDDLYTLFAEPKILPEDEIEWVSALEGPVVRYDQLTTKDQVKAESILVNHVQQMLALSKNDPDLQIKLKKWIEIPNKEQDIYLVDNKVVLTRWGFIDQNAARGNGEISYLLKRKVWTLSLLSRFDDDDVLPELEIDYTLKGKKDKITTNNSGLAVIPGIVDGETIQLSASYKDQTIEKEVQVTEESSCKLIFNKIFDLSFQVYFEETKEKATDQNFSLNFGSKRVEAQTNEHGELFLKSIRPETVITMVHGEGWSLTPDQFTCKEDQTLFKAYLTIPPPEIFEKKIRVYYERTKEPLPGATVKVTRGHKVEEYQSDDEGFIVIRTENEPIEGDITIEVEAPVPASGKRTWFQKMLPWIGNNKVKSRG